MKKALNVPYPLGDKVPTTTEPVQNDTEHPDCVCSDTNCTEGSNGGTVQTTIYDDHTPTTSNPVSNGLAYQDSIKSAVAGYAHLAINVPLRLNDEIDRSLHAFRAGLENPSLKTQGTGEGAEAQHLKSHMRLAIWELECIKTSELAELCRDWLSELIDMEDKLYGKNPGHYNDVEKIFTKTINAVKKEFEQFAKRIQNDLYTQQTRLARLLNVDTQYSNADFTKPQHPIRVMLDGLQDTIKSGIQAHIRRTEEYLLTHKQAVSNAFTASQKEFRAGNFVESIDLVRKIIKNFRQSLESILNNPRENDNSKSSCREKEITWLYPVLKQVLQKDFFWIRTKLPDMVLSAEQPIQDTLLATKNDTHDAGASMPVTAQERWRTLYNNVKKFYPNSLAEHGIIQMSDNTIILPPKLIVHPDGTTLSFQSGTVLLSKEGALQNYKTPTTGVAAYGSRKLLPDGTILHDSGFMVLPVGAMLLPDGSIKPTSRVIELSKDRAMLPANTYLSGKEVFIPLSTKKIYTNIKLDVLDGVEKIPYNKIKTLGDAQSIIAALADREILNKKTVYHASIISPNNYLQDIGLQEILINTIKEHGTLIEMPDGSILTYTPDGIISIPDGVEKAQDCAMFVYTLGNLVKIPDCITHTPDFVIQDPKDTTMPLKSMFKLSRPGIRLSSGAVQDYGGNTLYIPPSKEGVIAPDSVQQATALLGNEIELRPSIASFNTEIIEEKHKSNEVSNVPPGTNCNDKPSGTISNTNATSVVFPKQDQCMESYI